MRKFCLLQLLVFSLITINTIKAQDSNLPDWNIDYLISKDISYGGDSSQNMDIYRSKDSKAAKKLPLVVFIHGGGYYFSDKSQEERYIYPYLQRGYHVVNLNYRLKRGIPIANEDLTTALNFLNQSKKEYGIKLNRVLVTGFSAGAQMATTVALSQNNQDYPHQMEKGIKIIAAVNFSGPVDDLDVVEKIFCDNENPTWQLVGNALFPDSEGYATPEVISVYEPMTYLDENDPPVFVWHGGNDTQIPPSTFYKFTAQLGQDLSKNQVMFIDSARHSPTKEQLLMAYEEVFKFLNRK